LPLSAASKSAKDEPRSCPGAALSVLLFNLCSYLAKEVLL
jgi:hypothetical protein